MPRFWLMPSGRSGSLPNGRRGFNMHGHGSWNRHFSTERRSPVFPAPGLEPAQKISKPLLLDCAMEFHRQSPCRRHCAALRFSPQAPSADCKVETADSKAPGPAIAHHPVLAVLGLRLSPPAPLHPAPSSLAGLFAQTPSMPCPFHNDENARGCQAVVL